VPPPADISAGRLRPDLAPPTRRCRSRCWVRETRATPIWGVVPGRGRGGGAGRRRWPGRCLDRSECGGGRPSCQCEFGHRPAGSGVLSWLPLHGEA